MKFKKYIYISSFIFLLSLSNNANAQSDDIQNIIFDANLYNSSTQTDIIFSSNQINEPYIISLDSKKNIDDIVEKALAEATKEEEQRVLFEVEEQKRKEEEERKKEAEREFELKKEREREREREVLREREREKERKREREKSKKDNIFIEDIVKVKTEIAKAEPYKSKQHLPEFFEDSEITQYAKSLLGIPYVYGGNTLKGLDCSSYVQTVYAKFKIKIPRTTFEQVKYGNSISLDNIRENDLIFFDTRAKKNLMKNTKSSQSVSFDDIKINESETTKTKLYPTQATHVGIYLGNGKFAHASSSKKKVVIEELNNAYFSNRIVDIKRYF